MRLAALHEEGKNKRIDAREDGNPPDEQPAVPVPVAVAKSFTREDLISIYKEELRRPPESEATIAYHLGAHETAASFRRSLMETEEYHRLQTPYPGRMITLDEIDGEMARLEPLAGSPTFQESMSEFWVSLPACGAAPDSDAYRAWVMETYSEIANRSYERSNERTELDIETNVLRPFPYSSGSARMIGEQLMAVGHVIHAMNLPQGASILEMGFGWGNTTVQLALSGYHVTGIDIGPDYVELVRRRTQILSLDADLRVGEFFDIERMEEQFDAVLFFECFHHCADHIRLLKAIPKVLKSGGRLVLAGETINNALPYPWGINPGGQAIYCIRHHGWLELCFRENYLLQLLDDLGWNVEKHAFNQAAGVTYIATRK